MKLTCPSLGLFGVVLTLVFISAGPAQAADSGIVFGSYWDEFFKYWKSLFQKQNGVVMGVLGVGVVALFIITRGKWRK